MLFVRDPIGLLYFNWARCDRQHPEPLGTQALVQIDVTCPSPRIQRMGSAIDFVLVTDFQHTFWSSLGNQEGVLFRCRHDGEAAALKVKGQFRALLIAADVKLLVLKNR